MTWGDRVFAFHGPASEVNDPTVLDRYLLNSRINTIALDLETVSLKDTTPIGIGIAIDPSRSFYFPLEPVSPSIPWGLLSDPKVKKVWYNALFDLSVKSPIMQLVDHTNIADVYIMSKYLDYPPSLDLMARMYNLPVGNIQELLKKYRTKTMLGVPTEEVALKCCLDTEATFFIYEELKGLVHPESYNIDMQLIPMLAHMTGKGLRINNPLLRKFHGELKDEEDQLRGICEEEYFFNPGSTKQVAVVLMKRGSWIPIRRSRKTQRMNASTRDEILNKLEDPLAGMVLRYRKVQKLRSTYLEKLLEEERVFTQLGIDAGTGRLTSGGSSRSTPGHVMENLQNWPSKPPFDYIRNAIIPDYEVFTDFDCSQLELRILAYMSGDRHMIYVFESGGDIHAHTAEVMKRPRKVSKNVNFAMIYGATLETICETAETQDLDMGRKLIYEWSSNFPDAWQWIIQQQEEGVRNGEISTLYGRAIPLPTNESEDGIRRKAVNYPIQGTAAEIMKRMMLVLKPRTWMDCRLQVHDEMILDGDYKQEVIDLKLDEIAPFPTPVSVKTISRWE